MSDAPATETELDRMFREGAAEGPPHADPEEGGEGADGEHAEGDHEAAPPRRVRKPHHEMTIKELNLTAMMDMMTIILVFLLKNYATNPEAITLSAQLQPPSSTAKVPMQEATVVMVTTLAILVDGKEILKLQDGKVAGEDPKTASTLIPPLRDKLTARASDLKKIAEYTKQPFEGKVLIVADKNVPYVLLMRVLYTIGEADFSQYKLVTKGAGNAGVEIKQSE